MLLSHIFEDVVLTSFIKFLDFLLLGLIYFVWCELMWLRISCVSPAGKIYQAHCRQSNKQLRAGILGENLLEIIGRMSISVTGLGRWPAAMLWKWRESQKQECMGRRSHLWIRRHLPFNSFKGRGWLSLGCPLNANEVRNGPLSWAYIFFALFIPHRPWSPKPPACCNWS